MAPLGTVSMGVTDHSVTEMERTHELAREIGAPDLVDGFVTKNAESGKMSPAGHSAAFAQALGRGARAAARKSIERRRVPGFCNRGHALTPDNTKRRQCRTCDNARRRHRRALGLAA